MSRSYKKTPIGGCCSSGGQKKFKEYEHRAERSRIKILLKVNPEIENLPHHKEYGNEWSSPRDGKIYFGDMKGKKFKDYREYGRLDLESDITWHEMYIRGLRK